MFTNSMTMLSQTGDVGTNALLWLGLFGVIALLFLFFVVFVIKQYKRCPSNRILVIYGKVGWTGMVWLLGLLLKMVYDLQSSGNINIKDAHGAEGSVYVSIPANGKRGQVRLVINGRQRMFNAVTEGTPIDARSRVRVTRVNRDNTLTVVAI